MQLHINEKCFARGKKGKCNVLVGNCFGNYAACPFYKPTWMAERDARKRLYRISEMTMEKQRAIADKYYRGQMPWRLIKWQE